MGEHVRLAAIAAVLIAVGLIAYKLANYRPPHDVNSAVASMVGIRNAAREYASKYKNGFPQSLQILGPPTEGSAPNCNAANLVDHVLAAGAKSSYTFVYIPGPLNRESAEGCVPGVQRFHVLARPMKYRGTGHYSFYLDESGAIRLTGENRAANAKDKAMELK